ncbi:ABC transporter permease [Longicatena caecimuris]|uniref:ABC transporter permease n=2 Tax=Longicatena caecimuris TaxID=1796635 RepID=UPI00399AD5E9
MYKYLQELNIGVPISIEYLADKTPAMAVKQVSTAYKTKTNIIGGYEAELPFAIYHRAKVNDLNSILAITKPLNIMADIFDMETENHFPNLTLPGYVPVKIEMVSTPADDTGKQNNIATFMAMYKLTYKKKVR